jgi:hypothetical protein
MWIMDLKNRLDKQFFDLTAGSSSKEKPSIYLSSYNSYEFYIRNLFRRDFDHKEVYRQRKRYCVYVMVFH